MTLAAATETRSYTGTIKLRFESDLGFRVSGKIVERLINIGDKVTPGMTLARLDATDYQLSLESADAELKAAESSLAQADADETRYARLTQGGWTSAASFDQKKAAADEARGRVERSARSHWRRTSSTIRACARRKPASLPRFRSKRVRWSRPDS